MVDTTRDRAAVRTVAVWVADQLAGQVVRDRDDVRLAVHEVVANAVLHGGPPVRVRIHLVGGEHVDVEVSDAGTDDGARAAPTRPPAERGRGLAIAAACSDHVEFTAHDGGGRSVRLRYAAAVTTPPRP